MKLGDVEQRFKLIDGLIKAAFKNDEVFMPGNENYYEWLSNMEILKLLLSLGDMIRTERILLYAVNEMERVKVSDPHDKEIAVKLARDKLTYFVDTILLHMLDHTLGALRQWRFESDRGKKFHRSVHKKLDALVEAYQDVYGL